MLILYPLLLILHHLVLGLVIIEFIRDGQDFMLFVPQGIELFFEGVDEGVSLDGVRLFSRVVAIHLSLFVIIIYYRSLNSITIR